MDPWYARLRSSHALSANDVMARLEVGTAGLDDDEIDRRRLRFGPNRLPEPQPPHLVLVFLRQFGNPLIYILLAAAVLAAWEQDWSDAGFIGAVLLINAVIGTFQEHQAARSAAALSRMVEWQATVVRTGDVLEVPAADLVPGDLVILEAGIKVPADVRLILASALEIDESILTGESLPVRKDAGTTLAADTTLADQTNMAFAGTLVARGRGQGVVVATGVSTALGQLSMAGEAAEATPPLLQRMERFTRTLAIVIGLASLAIACVGLLEGQPWREVMLLAVALAVSAIPEGLPVALTIALAVATRRMAARRVIVRHLVSVEALGSCTFIASDKTGTLTVNQLTATVLALPGEPLWTVSGSSLAPVGTVTAAGVPLTEDQRHRLTRLCTAAVLANEGTLSRRPDDSRSEGAWHGHGDAADVALLVMAHKVGITRMVAQAGHRHLTDIPFDPEHRFAASLEQVRDGMVAYVKGAPERVVAMCERIYMPDGGEAIDAAAVMARAAELAAQGYRVLAVAAGLVSLGSPREFDPSHLRGLTCLGLVGMIDPLRPEARQAVADSRSAGVEVAMVTGDHPVTALAIARELGLAHGESELATGSELRQASQQGEAALAQLVAGRHVFARVEPRQKLEIVTALQRSGHFVAVTGDGANDVPALRAAHVSVAMGRSGTDIARESADLILADDNFASIVAGIQEGRIAYSNIRKVIFLLVSTGAGGLVLFILASLFALPLPLLPVQLLWLNLVTNCVQHIALSFEPGEGDELQRPPRSPDEPVFDPLMVRRIALSGLYMGGVACALFAWQLSQGFDVAVARNNVLFLMVLFQNVQVFNSRSERHSLFRQPFWTNPLLIAGVPAALLIHVLATLWGPTQRLLSLQPLTGSGWLWLTLLALGLIAVIEVAMLAWRRMADGHRRDSPRGPIAQ
jgi:magnesium-transporting ATPase (P-type)